MDWVDTIFSYCERAGDTGLFAEPVNTITNIAFFLAAALAHLHQRKQPSINRDIDCTIFIVLVALMGLGSTLFHVFAQRWALVADVVPITIFILVYMNYALNRFLNLTPGVSFLLTGAYLMTAPALAWIPGGITGMNGSVSFVPAFLVLLTVGLIMQRRGHPGAWWLLTAAGVFAVSLTFRTIDKAVCNYTVVADHATGTHGLWHILNATLLYLLIRGAIDHGRHGEQTYEVLTPVGPKEGT